MKQLSTGAQQALIRLARAKDLRYECTGLDTCPWIGCAYAGLHGPVLVRWGYARRIVLEKYKRRVVYTATAIGTEEGLRLYYATAATGK